MIQHSMHVGGRDPSVGVPKISLLKKYECYLLLCYWSLLCCWLRCSSRYHSMEFCGDAHMFCVAFQHTPAMFRACCEDWTDVDCKCGSMSSSGLLSSHMSISKVKTNQIQMLFLVEGKLGLQGSQKWATLGFGDRPEEEASLEFGSSLSWNIQLGLHLLRL